MAQELEAAADAQDESSAVRGGTSTNTCRYLYAVVLNESANGPAGVSPPVAGSAR